MCPCLEYLYACAPSPYTYSYRCIRILSSICHLIHRSRISFSTYWNVATTNNLLKLKKKTFFQAFSSKFWIKRQSMYRSHASVAHCDWERDKTKTWQQQTPATTTTGPLQLAPITFNIKTAQCVLSLKLAQCTVYPV